MIPRPPISTLFPYTTLFRSSGITRSKHRRFAWRAATRPALHWTGVAATLVVALYRSEEHTSELQSHSDLVCRLLLEKKKKKRIKRSTEYNNSQCHEHHRHSS